MFEAYSLVVEMLGAVRKPIDVVRTRNRDLAIQMERAAASVLLNLAEGRKRSGKDRIHLWRIAAGSNDEVRAALDVGRALGYFDGLDLGQADNLLDRCAAILWRLTH